MNIIIVIIIIVYNNNNNNNNNNDNSNSINDNNADEAQAAAYEAQAAADEAEAKMAAKALCSVCLRVLSVTATGLIRSHGPVGDRCPGSRKPPKQPDASPRLTQSGSGRGPSSGLSPTASLGVRSAASVVSMDLAASFGPFPAARTLGRIPKAARYQCRAKLTTIMEEVVGENSIDAWNHLFQFPTCCLRMPE